MDYEGGDTREQGTGQRNLQKVKLKTFLHHCCNRDKQMKHGGPGSRLRGRRAEWCGG
jgi:hypothetical protein